MVVVDGGCHIGIFGYVRNPPRPILVVPFSTYLTYLVGSSEALTRKDTIIPERKLVIGSWFYTYPALSMLSVVA